MTGWRAWIPDAGAGLVVLLLGLIEVAELPFYFPQTDPRPAAALVVIGIAAAVTLCRQLPTVALALVWLLCTMQLLTDTSALVIEAAVGAVAFGVARWGGTATLWLSAASIPVAALVAVYGIDARSFYALLDTAGFRALADRATPLGDNWQLTAAVMGMLLLGVPWLAGLALRFSAGARTSRASQVAAEAERDQAEEIAHLRERQAQLARDVHDVVGHSLAVILAQAESAQFLDDGDVTRLKQTMTNIATSARSSLEDVRQVLATTSGAAPPRTVPVDLEKMVEGVRAGGHDVRTTEVGSPQPLPPELEVVAFRVLQEMLTNAIKHGRRDRPVLVERHWEGELRIEVQNTVAEATQPSRGQGLEGMRRRLESVGGRLDVRRREEPPTFTVTAWVPVRAE